MLKTCGSKNSLQYRSISLSVLRRKQNKTAGVVLFGVKILTSLIHGLLLNEQSSVKR
jgi:hypothetical protein